MNEYATRVYNVILGKQESWGSIHGSLRDKDHIKVAFKEYPFNFLILNTSTTLKLMFS